MACFKVGHCALALNSSAGTIRGAELQLFDQTTQESAETLTHDVTYIIQTRCGSRALHYPKLSVHTCFTVSLSAPGLLIETAAVIPRGRSHTATLLFSFVQLSC